MTGKVFIDNHDIKGKEDPNGIMSGMIRQGNGKYDNGEANVGGVKITLTENTGSGKVYKATTDGNGDFKIEGYIPGDYTLTYTWGGKTHTINGQNKEIAVQDYKGTVYDYERYQKNYEDNENNKKWWKTWEYKYVKNGDKWEEQKTSLDSNRYTDAVDDYNARLDIDKEIQDVKKDTTITRDKMDSTTPTMGIGVEYETTYSASTGNKYTYCIDNIDFGIIERAKQNLVLNKRIKKMKVTLANGQVIADLEVTIDEKGNYKITGDKKGITYMQPSATTSPQNGFIRLELDNELIQGSKLEVEYEIKATNNSEVDYVSEKFYKCGVKEGEIVAIHPTGIIDYLDKNWAFDLSQNNQITEVKTNAEAIRDLVTDDVIENENSTIGEKMILYSEYLANTPLQPVKDKDTATITFNVSKLLTTTDEISLNNEVEEVEVKKTGGSRLQTTPGNYVPGMGSKEVDDSMAETAIVTPATGENQNYILPIAIGVTVLIILGAGVIIIKKKVI